MYDLKSNLVIGFHGCEADVRNELLLHPTRIKFSQKPFDWLGHGLYFWENNYERAMQWANGKRSRGDIEVPAVIGAVLQLRYCCDFLESRYIDLLRNYYQRMAETYLSSGNPLPVNKDVSTDLNKDKLLRYLDCAAIEYMHKNIIQQAMEDKIIRGFSDFKVFDSVRGAFPEGGPAFEGSGIFAKMHVQICIRNPNCIKGFFIPREEINFHEGMKSGIFF